MYPVALSAPALWVDRLSDRVDVFGEAIRLESREARQGCVDADIACDPNQEAAPVTTDNVHAHTRLARKRPC
jgi:hypothetical protein